MKVLGGKVQDQTGKNSFIRQEADKFSVISL